jgi:site-specific recombinase XerD
MAMTAELARAEARVSDPTGIAAAVAALPALPSADPLDRYSVRRLTAAWLAEAESPHTRRGYFRDLSAFLTWCQRQRLDPLTARATDLGQYRVWLQLSPGRGRRSTPPSATTIARALCAVSSWYTYLVANTDGHVAHNPMAGVRRPRVDRDASTTGLSLDEIDALLDSADTEVRARERTLAANPSPTRHARYLASLRDRALVRLLADAGLRIGEGLALDLDALSHNQGYRTVRFLGKGNKRRERPLGAHTLEAVDEYLAARAQTDGVPVEQLAGPLFATTGRDGGVGRLDEPAAFRLIRRLAHHAGLPSAQRLSPHSLRHAFAANAREDGIPLEDVQDAMGHADARTTRRYDRGRHALHRDPGLRMAALHADRASRRGLRHDEPSEPPE